MEVGAFEESPMSAHVAAARHDRHIQFRHITFHDQRSPVKLKETLSLSFNFTGLNVFLTPLLIDRNNVFFLASR